MNQPGYMLKKLEKMLIYVHLFGKQSELQPEFRLDY